MTSGKDYAHPLRNRWDNGADAWDLEERGLTKRELFAVMAMQGYIANSHEDLVHGVSSARLVEGSVKLADLLIDALNK